MDAGAKRVARKQKAAKRERQESGTPAAEKPADEKDEKKEKKS